MESVQCSTINTPIGSEAGGNDVPLERAFVLDYVARVPDANDTRKVPEGHESSEYSMSQSSDRRESRMRPRAHSVARSRATSFSSHSSKTQGRPPAAPVVSERKQMSLIKKEYLELEKSVKDKEQLETEKDRQFKMTKRLETALKIEMGDVNGDKETINSLEDGLKKSRRRLEKIQKAYKTRTNQERRMRELEQRYSHLLRNHSPKMRPLYEERDSLRQLKKGIRLALQDQTSALSYIGKSERALFKIEEKLSVTRKTDASRLSMSGDEVSEYSVMSDELEQVSIVKLLPYRILSRGTRTMALARYHKKSATKQLWAEVNDQFREAMLYAPHLPTTTGREVKDENSLEEVVLLKNPPRKGRKTSWEEYISTLLEMVNQGRKDLNTMRRWQARLISEIRSDHKSADGKLKVVEKKLAKLRAKAMRESSLK
eukprot:Plantae.Rhodophyta-Hildenbrandia_rubra.ctg209.p1 GENE.Plantae.Rhodophyta-Hildenbrandia_rubra.ctg209~~Plantae.Rhodophyta-Hildenbrandia_rubra.ctg209.p1  ORF type:complete len:429 (+),score=92.76 Plantae.Rhodophyta-Hildenbrandia_rubra.ctg209:67-1353(+)